MRTELSLQLRSTIDFTLFAAADAGPGLALAAAVLGVAALAAGVWRMQLRWWLAGGGLLFFAVLWAALASEPGAEAIGDGQPQTLDVLTLRVRPTDSRTEQPVAAAEIAIIRHRRSPADGNNRAVADDGLSNVSVASRASDGVTMVSALIEAAPRGTVWNQLRRPRTDLAGYELIVEASGYQTWRAALDDLLPDGWPIEPARPELIEARLVAEP